MKRRQILVRDIGKTLCLLLIIGGLAVGSSVALGGKLEIITNRPYKPASMVGVTYHMNGENWLDGWTYRKSHTIQGSSVGSVTNYPIQLKVHYGNGVDSGKEVYLNEHCRTDFGDLRFTRNDGQTELDYWVEEKQNGNYAIVWIEAESIPASPNSTVVYLYYGNNAVTTTSNGTNTFLFFDDFESGSIDTNKWNTNLGSPSIDSTSGKKRSSYGVKLDSGGERLAASYSPSSSIEYAFSYYVYYETINQFTYNYFSYTGGSDDLANVGWLRSNGELLFGDASNNQNISISAQTLYKVELLGIDFSSDNIDIARVDGSSRTNLGLHDTNPEYPTDQTNKVWFENHLSAYPTYYVDEVILRKYVGPEPSHGSWGSEETTGTPTVTIMNPNGGEVWSGTQTIIWTALDPQNDPLIFTVYYSPNGGATWTQLAVGLTMPSYSWDTTTVVNGANYLVKVEAHDGTYTGPDVSNAPFEIMNAPPSTTTTTPETTTTTTTPETTTTTTTTPETTTTTTVLPNMAPTVRVLRPNGGEQIYGMYEIQWSANDPDGDTLTFTLSYSPNGGQTWTLIASGVTETSYTWDTSMVQVGDNYLIEVGASDEALSAVDQSDAPFTIARETPTTSPKSSFIPSFGLVEALGAILTLLGLGSWQRKRTG